MSILGTLFSKILGHKAQAPAAATPGAPKATAPTSGGASTSTAAPPNPAPPAAKPAAGVPRMDDVDLEHLLDDLADKSGQKLDWRHSIVDLMKAVGMDSSLAERKALAKELGYAGDTADSATMNVWLHGEVINRIAANGGRVPATLKD